MSDKEKKFSLFRKEALESLYSTKNLEQLMILVSPKNWIAIYCFFTITLLVVIWTFFGVIPDAVEGTGILINQEGNFIGIALEDGYVDKILVNAGENVKKDDVLMKMKNKIIDLNYKNAIAKRDLLKSQFEAFKRDHFLKLGPQKKAVESAITTAEISAKLTEEEIKVIEKDLLWKLELYKKGLIPLALVNAIKEKIHGKQIAVEQFKTSILDNRAKLKDLGETQPLQQFQLALESAEAVVKDLQLLEDRLIIKSPVTGSILEITVKETERVAKNQTIFWLEQESDQHITHYMYAYFSSAQNQRIEPGMLVEVRLNKVDEKTYGYLLMRVKRVWAYPTSMDEMTKIIGNKLLVNYLAKKESEAPIQAVLEPIYDETTPSGYLWTSKKGPPFIIESGSIGTAKVLIEIKRPIEYVLPLFRSFKDTVILMKLKTKQ